MIDTKGGFILEEEEEKHEIGNVVHEPGKAFKCFHKRSVNIGNWEQHEGFFAP